MTERMRVAWLCGGTDIEPGRILHVERRGVMLLQLDRDGQRTGGGFTEQHVIRIPEGPAAVSSS